jgi:hypothetical protein
VHEPVVPALLLAKIVLFAGEVVGSEELAREIPDALETTLIRAPAIG